MPKRLLVSTGLAALSAGCSGVQSSLDPGGTQAERIAVLYWWMAGGASLIWVGVLALAGWCFWTSNGRQSRRRDRALIVGGGVVFPVAVLTALLAYGLAEIPPLVARAPSGSVRVAVTGEQWWWRVRYTAADGSSFETANEVRLPVGEQVQFSLDSDNVIHSFWIPALGGKMDMIPGRVTWLALQPTRTGTFRGTCAEYCGGSHALMAFDVAVVERPAFDDWLAHQARPAVTSDAEAEYGHRVFLANGCSACHTIRGTTAAGPIGPDLTHVGSRTTLAASLLANDIDGFRRWIAGTQHLKPQARMPAFGVLPARELHALAAYLESLQ
jgi:cytochrome c oxidase subunit 2